MSNPDPDHQIQSRPGLDPSPMHLTERADSTRSGEAMPLRRREQRDVSAGMLFGALAGLCAGVVVGVACCWLTGRIDILWHGALIGALLGLLGGALIGSKERKAQGNLVRPNIATLICAGYGLLPALLFLLRGLTLVRGKFSGYGLIGMAFVGPMLGLLIGAILDRAYEASRKKSWGVALGFGASGMAACITIVYVIAATSHSKPDPKDVASQARALILREWRKQPELRDAMIQNVTLVHQEDNVYTGVVEATIQGQTKRLRVQVVYEDEVLELEVGPLKE